MKGVLATIALAPILWGCEGWLGFVEEDFLQGDRVSVFSPKEGLEATGDDTPFLLPESILLEEWTQHDGNSLNLAVHAEFTGALEMVWSASPGSSETTYSRILSQPVIGEGHVFYLDGRSQVVALSLERRRTAWTLNLLPDGESADASLGGGLAIEGGVLFVTTPYGQIAALDPADGSIFWSRSFGIPFRSAPTVRSPRVYANLVSDRTIALRADEGTDLWTHEGAVKQGPSLLAAGSLAANDDLVISPYSSGEIVALRADSGRVAWRAQLTQDEAGSGTINVEDVSASPVIDGNTIIAAGAGGPLSALETRSGTQLWSLPVPVERTPRIAGDWLFVLSSQDEAMCVSRLTGETRWVVDLRELVGMDVDDDLLWTGITLAGGQVIVVGNDRALALSPENGALMRTAQIPGQISGAPVAVGGNLYVLTRAGSIVAFR